MSMIKFFKIMMVTMVGVSWYPYQGMQPQPAQKIVPAPPQNGESLFAQRLKNLGFGYKQFDDPISAEAWNKQSGGLPPLSPGEAAEMARLVQDMVNNPKTDPFIKKLLLKYKLTDEKACQELEKTPLCIDREKEVHVSRNDFTKQKNLFVFSCIYGDADSYVPFILEFYLRSMLRMHDFLKPEDKKDNNTLKSAIECLQQASGLADVLQTMNNLTHFMWSSSMDTFFFFKEESKKRISELMSDSEDTINDLIIKINDGINKIHDNKNIHLQKIRMLFSRFFTRKEIDTFFSSTIKNILKPENLITILPSNKEDYFSYSLARDLQENLSLTKLIQAIGLRQSGNASKELYDLILQRKKTNIIIHKELKTTKEMLGSLINWIKTNKEKFSPLPEAFSKFTPLVNEDYIKEIIPHDKIIKVNMVGSADRALVNKVLKEMLQETLSSNLKFIKVSEILKKCVVQGSSHYLTAHEVASAIEQSGKNIYVDDDVDIDDIKNTGSLNYYYK